VVLMPGAEHQVAMARAEHFREAVAADVLNCVPVTISIGVASCTRHAIGSLALLLGEADRAMYAAKTSGRN
jgi:diguanylate cyclase (GGDEF)-like protein